MAHNGVDIDQYLLLILYPSIAFFVTGFITKKKDVKKTITYIIQAIICFIFSISYYLFVPRGGAGIALVLGLFGIMLLILARKEKINPSTEEGEGGEESKVNDEEQERQR